MVKAMDFVSQVEVVYNEHWGYIWGTAGVMWTEKKQKALKAEYEKDPKDNDELKLGAEVGSKWIGHMVTDCSGLPLYVLKKLGVKGIYHGSNSQFSKNCSKVGKIEKGVKIPIGALIFTGTSTHPHVGVLTSPTTVTEAQGTYKGVIHTPLSNKKWTYYGLLKCVEYDDVPADDTMPPAENWHPTLRRGSKGDAVKELQTLLASHGSSLTIDGIFGSGTLSAVKAFQKRMGLVVDGVVGPKTWKALEDHGVATWVVSVRGLNATEAAALRDNLKGMYPDVEAAEEGGFA